MAERRMYLTGELFCAAIGGGCGAALRYWISAWAAQRWIAFPYGTLLVNLTGCFLLGFFMTVTAQHEALPPFMRPLFVAGFLGGLTTFSTFSFDSLQLLLSGNTLQAFANIAGNLLLGLAATFAGLLLGRFVSFHM